MSARRQNRLLSGGVLLSLLVPGSTLGQTARPAAVELAAPSNVTSAVRRAVSRSGKNFRDADGLNVLAKALERKPDAVYIRKENGSGNWLWELHWMAPDEVSQNDTTFTVNEKGKVVGFSDNAAYNVARADFEAGKSMAITEAQAMTALDDMAYAIGAYPGVWRDDPPVLRRYGGDNNKEGQPYWEVGKRRLVGGFAVNPGFMFAMVDPYRGRITNFSYRDDAVLIPPSRPLFMAEQLEPVAIKAFEEYAAPVLRPGDSHKPSHSPKRPHWRLLSDESPLCRLQYVFSFNLTFLDDPTFEAKQAKDPNDFNWYGRAAREIWVEMDAESGEILGVWTASGNSAGLTYTLNSEWAGMMYTMLQVKPADALALALIGGFPLPSSALPDPKDKSLVRFHRAINGKTRYFAFAPKSKRLFWQTGGDKKPVHWAGVSLNEERTAALARLLKGNPESAPAAKTGRNTATPAAPTSAPPPI